MADPMVEDEVMSEEEEEDDEEEDEEDHSLANPEAVTKYNTCAGIANKVLAHLVKQCKPGRKIVELCTEGDKLIKEEVSKIYNKKKTDKGVAFPTCISTNNCVGHYSPLSDDVAVLQEGDLVKIDLGCHVDGIIAVVGHTIVCQAADNAAPVTGRKADVICAAHLAKECALRLMRPGKKNTDVTEAIQKVAEAFHCQPVEGVLSHQMKRYVVDGNKVILNKALPEHKVDEFTFEENEVYGVDIVISTGEGKTKELESRTTVYKRAVETNYLLKMKASRYIYNEINAQYPTFPFTIRAFDEKRSRLGIVELLKHGLVHPYPVLYEKPGEFVAQFKFTVLILPSNISMITGHELPHVKSEYSITDPKLLAVLELGTKRTSQKKKNKKKGKKKAEGAAAAPAATPAAAPAAAAAAPAAAAAAPAASAPAAASMDTS